MAAAATREAQAPVANASATPAVPGHTAHSGHRRNKSKNNSDDPFLKRNLTAEVGSLLGQTSPSHANDDAQHDSPSLLLADVRNTATRGVSSVSLG